MLERLEGRFDRTILDCPPGLTETSEQVLRAADIVLVPVIPSPLARRSFDEMVAHIAQYHGAKVSILPVFSMVDRRRALHRAALEEHPDWPTIPMASAVEQMGIRQASIGTFAPSSPAAQAFAFLWRAVERKLTEQKQ